MRKEPGIAVLALGAEGRRRAEALRREGRERGVAVSAVALAEPVPAAPATSSPGVEVTRSVLDFARVELPARAAAAPPEPLAPGCLVAPVRPSAAALRAALAAAPAWLPPEVAGNPERWLAGLGEPPRPDAMAWRLGFRRLAGDFGRALDDAGWNMASRRFLVLAAGDPLAEGALPEVLDLAGASGSPTAVVLIGASGGEPVCAELEERESAPMALLVAPAASAGELFDVLELAGPDPALAAARYRGRPLRFAVARVARVGVAIASAEWAVAREAVAAAVAHLRGRKAGDPAAAAAALEAGAPLPAFTLQALRPLADLVREARTPAPPAPGNEEAGAFRRRADAWLARRQEEAADREARLKAEIDEWLNGGKLSLLRARSSRGFLSLLEEAVGRELAAGGTEAARALLAAFAARLAAREGGPRVQLRPRLQELEQRRGTLAAATRSGSATLGSLLARRDPAAEGEQRRLLGEYARTVGEMARLIDLQTQLAAAHDLLDAARAALGGAEAGLAGLVSSLAAVADALDRVPLEPALVALVQELAGPEHAPGALLARALTPGAVARWAASPQALLDELWAPARVPLTPAAILGRMPGAARQVAEALASGAGIRHEVLPRRLAPRSSFRISAPSEATARAALAELPVVAEPVVDPAMPELRGAGIAAGLPRFALAGGPAAPARGATWSAVAGRALGARGLDGLLRAAADLAELERVAGPDEREETDMFLALRPALTAVAKAQEVADPATRVHYLEEARGEVARWGERAGDGLVEPERALAVEAARRWAGAIEEALCGARGRAEVTLRLRTRRLGLAAASTWIEVEVAAHGAVPAEQVAVALLPGQGFRILDEGRVALGRLPAGSSSVASFQVRPGGPGRIEVRVQARWDDLAGSGREAALAGEVELFAAPPGFRRIARNPYIAGPPVRSESMFFGRADLFEFVRDNLRGRHQNNVLLLHGNRRTGKSSLLYQLERGAHVAPFVPVYLDLQGLGKVTTGSFFAALARKTVRALAGHGTEAPDPPEREALDGEAAFERMNEFLDDLEASPWGSPPLLVMIDEFEILEDRARAGKVAGELFGWLRAKMQHSDRIAFLLAGTHRLQELDPELWAPLLSLCLGRHVSFLGEAETRALVTRPVEGELDFDDLALEAILRLTGGQPYYVQLLCQLLVAGMNERAASNVVTLDDIHEASARLMEAGGGQFQYEWGAARSAAGRLVLAALGELADSSASWVDVADLAARAGLDREVADSAVRELAGRDLVRLESGAARARMDLFRQWLRRERPIARARAEAAAEAE